MLDEYPDVTIAADASVGLALADAQAGKRDEAVAVLRDLESRFPGQPVARRAAKERARLERHAPKKK